MKIKISKSQWEEMGKKKGWIKEAHGQKFPYNLPSHYVIRVEDPNGGLIDKFKTLPEANERFEAIVKDDWNIGGKYYLVEISERVLKAEAGRRKG